MTWPAAATRAFPNAADRESPAAADREFPVPADREWPSSGGPTPPPPYVGTKAAQLDGVDEYLTATSTTLNPSTGFGFSCWMLRNDVVAEETLFHCRESGTRQFGVYGNGATMIAYVQRTTLFSVTSGSIISAGQWHHVAVAVDGANRIRLWVDGALIGTTSGTTTGTIVGPAAVGRAQLSATWYLNGKICDVAIWPTTLTDGNVTAMYNGGERGDPEALSGLTAAKLWPFQSTDSMVGTVGGIADLKGGTALTPLNTESGDLVDGPP